MSTISQILVFLQLCVLFSMGDAECLDGVCPVPLASMPNFTKEGVIDDEGKIPFPFLCFLLVVLFHPLLSFPPTRGLFVLVAGLLMNAYHDVIRLTVTKLVLIAVFYLG
jgi:hypothetical protein